MAIWPAYAQVSAGDYAVRDAETTRRTQFEDGGLRQARAFTNAFTNAFTIRQIVVVLENDDDRIRFRGWAASHAHEWFSWADPDDGVLRRVRVVGGAGGIDYRAVIGPSRTRSWRARLALEGLWSDTV